MRMKLEFIRVLFHSSDYDCSYDIYQLIVIRLHSECVNVVTLQMIDQHKLLKFIQVFFHSTDYDCSYDIYRFIVIILHSGCVKVVSLQMIHQHK
jgi:CRISPR/Cas system endoribonuclease Cas6 (RAMP superfamily)